MGVEMTEEERKKGSRTDFQKNSEVRKNFLKRTENYPHCSI